MKYILDSNCFITPSRGFCPMDVGVSFWEKIKDLADRGVIYSLDKVKDEIYRNDDELSKWIKANLKENFFLKFEGELRIGKLQSIIREIDTSTFYTPKAKAKFLDIKTADIYLVAYACVNPLEWTIVSLEHRANSPTEIKLPNACDAYKVHYLEPQDMFRELHETF